jgi:hypothetical protein
MISRFKMPFSFDPGPLKADVERVAAGDWVAHFNSGYYEDGWSGVALRSVGGVATNLYPDPNADFADSPLMDRCPNVRAALASFQCPLRAVRLLKLAVGSSIREHRDPSLGYEDGQVRFHVPITSNPDVDFFLDAHRVEMKAGECWYLDLSLPHWVENHGSTDRVHLVIDCDVNEWLRKIILAEDSLVRPAIEDCVSSPEELERFRRAVLGDLRLQRRLRQTADMESFVRLVVTVSRKLGYRFTAADVEDALRASHLTWIGRWID